MDEARYYGIEDAARYTGLSVSYLQKLTSRRRVPFLEVLDMSEESLFPKD